MAQLKKPTVKNPALVEAITAFRQSQNPQTEETMLQAAQEASFIAPITLQKQLDDITPDENGQRQVQASLMAVSAPNGPKLFPAFTDWLEFLKWKNDPDADTMVLTFDQYCDILLKQNIDVRGIVINPAETNVVIQKEKMAELKGVTLQETAPKANDAISALFGANKVTNPDLISAIAQLRAENSQTAQRAVFDALRKGRFVAPAIMREMPKAAKPGEKINAKAEFIMINHEDKKFLPVFTDLSELQKWQTAPKGCRAVPLTFAQYTGILSDPKNTAFGIVINPFSVGLTFTKEQVLSIQPRLELQDLKVIPMDMLQELKEYLSSIPAVKRAYLSGVKTNDKDGHLILVEMQDVKELQGIANSIVEIAKKHGSCVVAPTDSPLGQKAIAGKAPFYEAEG